MASAADDLNRFAQFVPPNWTKRIDRLFASLPASPVVKDVSFSIDNGMVKAQFTVEIPSDLVEEWKVALDTSGASISVTPLGSSLSGPAEYVCNFPISMNDDLKGDA
jgi:hypothetical protein